MKILLFIFVVLLQVPAWAQKIMRYEGRIPLVDGDSAFVSYGYYEEKNKRLLDGDYQLEATSSRRRDSLEVETIKWTGAFSENAKNGSWIYEYQQHKIIIRNIRDFKVGYKLISEHSSLEALYRNGSPTGQWNFSKNAYDQGVKTMSLAKVSFQFKNGKVSDSFSGFWNEHERVGTVSGTFDDRGFLHGDWKFNYVEEGEEIDEVRIYERGFLLSLVKMKAASTDTIQAIYYSDVVDKLQVMDRNKTAGLSVDPELHDLQFDIGYRQTDPELMAQQAGNDLLLSGIQEPLFLDTTFRRSSVRAFGTARFMHKTSSADSINIRITIALLDSIRQDLGSIKRKRFLELSSQQNDSMAWSNELLKRYPDRLEKLSSIVEFTRSEAFVFVDPELYLAQHHDFLSEIDTTNYFFGDKQKVKHLSFRTFPVTSIGLLKQRVLEEQLYIRKIVNYINNKLKSELQSYQLQKLDSLVLDMKYEVETFYDQVDQGEMKIITETFRRRFLNVEFNRLTRAYSGSNDFEEKLELGYDMLHFLDEVHSFPDMLSQIYARRDSIEQLYTETKLDPYTFAYVDVKVKKRLYEKVAIDLFDYMMDEAMKATTAEEVTLQLKAIQLLQEKLIDLRVQNTMQLEKQIKPKTTPDEVRQLLGV